MRALIKNTPKHYDFSVQGNKGILFPYVGKCFKIPGQVKIPVSAPPPAPPKPIITPALTGLVLIPPRTTYRVLITAVDVTVQETNVIYTDPPVIINNTPPRVECSLLGEPAPDNSFILESPDKTGADRVLALDCVPQPSPPLVQVVNKLGPVIVVQPASTKMYGGTASLFVVVEGTPPFSYQWRRNKQNLFGQVNSVITVEYEGLYDVIVSNAVGTVISEQALVTIPVMPITEEMVAINPTLTGYPPVITRQPKGGVLTEPPFEINLLAAGSDPLTYEWYLNDKKQTTDEQMTFNAYVSGSYYVKISNAFGSIESDIVDVITPAIAPVIAPVITPVNAFPIISPIISQLITELVTPATITITKQPVGGIINAGETFTLFVQADGTSPIEYQWRRGKIPISNETNTSIIVAQPGYYDVVVSNPAGTITSDLVEVIAYEIPIPYSNAECVIIAEESTQMLTIELESDISEQTVEFLCGDAKPIENWYITTEDLDDIPLLIDNEPTNTIEP